MRSAAAVLALFIVVVAAPIARGADHNEAAADSAARAWLALVDSGNYAESWKAASSFFRQSISQTQWQTAAAQARAPLGALKSRKRQSATFTRSLPGAPDGDYVVVIYAAAFETRATGVETVTLVVDTDGSWRASGYYVR